jgi:hypothetical protein
VRIEHHEVSIFAGPMPGAGAGSMPDQSGLTHIKPERCPVCGCTEMLLLAEAVAVASVSVAALKDGLDQGKYHLHRSASGEWWVCGESIRAG